MCGLEEEAEHDDEEAEAEEDDEEECCCIVGEKGWRAGGEGGERKVLVDAPRRIVEIVS